jgi:hypothetical protein
MADVSEAFQDVAQAIVGLKQEHVRAIARVRSRLTLYSVLTFLALAMGIAAIAASTPQILAMIDPTTSAGEETGSLDAQLSRIDGRVDAIDTRLSEMADSIAEILKANQLSAEDLDAIRKIVSQAGTPEPPDPSMPASAPQTDLPAIASVTAGGTAATAPGTRSAPRIIRLPPLRPPN